MKHRQRGGAARGRSVVEAGAVAFGAMVFVLTGSLLVEGCEYRSASESSQALQREEARATAPDQQSEQVRFFIYEDDRPRALVEAEQMDRYEGEDSTYTLLHAAEERPPRPADGSADGLTDSLAGSATKEASGRVTARIFEPGRDSTGAGGSVTATIRANRIVYDDDDQRFDARGQVVVTTAAGKRLESEHLTWLEEERRITTPGFVHITTPTDRIQGYGLRADENLDTYHLRRVTGQVTVEEAP